MGHGAASRPGRDNPASGLMDSLWSFLSDNWRRLPKAARVISYFIFLGVFVWGFTRVVSGNYVVRGEVFEKDSQGQLEPAIGYDVTLAGDYYGINGKGTYYVVLNPSKYFTLLATRTLAVKLTRKSGSRPPATWTLKYNVMENQLEEIDLEPGTTRVDTILQTPPVSGGPSLMPLAWARVEATTDARLFLTSVMLSPNVSNIREATWELFADGQVFPLLAIQAGGDLGGNLPVRSGYTVNLEPLYYFPFSTAWSVPSQEIRMRSQRGYFQSDYYENFHLADLVKLPGIGQQISLNGSSGSRIQAVLLSNYDVAVFRKTDLAGNLAVLQQRLVENGFRVEQRDSPLGEQQETNAIYAGTGVPLALLQKVVGVAAEQRLPIKTIQAHIALKSGNSKEIQIGGSTAYNSMPTLSADVIERLLAARTDDEFQSALASPAPTAARRQVERSVTTRSRSVHR